MMRATMALAGAALAATLHGAPGHAAEQTELTGELIDTWCYYSGVMGGPEATLGTAHHTCAIWCAAGGIPVGLLTETGDVYMVLDFANDGVLGNDAFLDIQTDTITVDATVYERDGLRYITINDVLDNQGITRRSHEDYGVIPGFAIPEEVINQ